MQSQTPITLEAASTEGQWPEWGPGGKWPERIWEEVSNDLVFVRARFPSGKKYETTGIRDNIKSTPIKNIFPLGRGSFLFIDPLAAHRQVTIWASLFSFVNRD